MFHGCSLSLFVRLDVAEDWTNVLQTLRNELKKNQNSSHASDLFHSLLLHLAHLSLGRHPNLLSRVMYVYLMHPSEWLRVKDLTQGSRIFLLIFCSVNRRLDISTPTALSALFISIQVISSSQYKYIPSQAFVLDIRDMEIFVFEVREKWSVLQGAETRINR